MPRALVIGAGPSGLVAAKYLLSSSDLSGQKYSVTVLESSNAVGGTFRNKVYDDARLVSSKYITAFSDHRMPESFPDHPTAEQYVEYLRGYCDRFDLWGAIRFRCEVISVSDAPPSEGGGAEDDREETIDAGGYTVMFRDRSGGDDGDGVLHSEHFDLVAVCSGLHNVPHVPVIPNLESFRGTVLHSSSYRDGSIFSGRRVLILGSGETAMDVALRAVRNPESEGVAVSVRSGFLSIPHSIAEGRPLDVFITNLFEHAYEHPWVHHLRLRWALSTAVIRLFLILAGSGAGFNQWACRTDPIRRGYHIINKSHTAMAHLNVPVKRRTAWGRLWMRLYGETDLRPIESFHRTEVAGVDDNGVTVRFEDGRTYDADVIVMATGYRQSFPFLDERVKEEHRSAQEDVQEEAGMKSHRRSHALEEDFLPSEHFIVSEKRPHLGFIGFVRPNVGAIPPMSELQVMWWLCNLRGEVQRFVPASERGGGKRRRRRQPPTYMVLGRKYRYGVDYGNYMHRVAEDMGAAPTLACLARSSRPGKALYAYCLGQAHAPLFRLVGPYASEECWEATTGELCRACLDRGWMENAGLLAVTWLSLWMNLGACLLEAVWGLCTARRPKFFARYG